MAIAAFYFGRGRSLSLVGGPGRGSALHSLPGYYGYYVAIWVVLPALILLITWVSVEPRLIVALVINPVLASRLMRVDKRAVTPAGRRRKMRTTLFTAGGMMVVGVIGLILGFTPLFNLMLIATLVTLVYFFLLRPASFVFQDRFLQSNARRLANLPGPKHTAEGYVLLSWLRQLKE